MNAHDNQENINKTTKDIINRSQNTIDNDLGFTNAFDGNVDSVHVGDNVSHFGFKERSIRNLPPDIISVPFHPENFQADHGNARGRSTATQTGNMGKRVDILLRDHSAIGSMAQAAEFRQHSYPLVNELSELLDLQHNSHHVNSQALTVETNYRTAQSFLTRFFKTDQEKRLIESLEKNKKYAIYYNKLLNKIVAQLKKYPVNEQEKQKLIDHIRLDIQELTLQKKELGIEARRADLKSGKFSGSRDKKDTNRNSHTDNNSSSNNNRSSRNNINSDKKSGLISNASNNTNNTIKDLFSAVPLSNNSNNKNTTSSASHTRKSDEGFNVFSLSGKNKGLLEFGDDGLLSFKDADRAFDNFFNPDVKSTASTRQASNTGSDHHSANSTHNNNKTAGSKRWGANDKSMSQSSGSNEQEEAEIEIDKKIIALERRIIALERFN
jgi:hypothetical protein